jgi:hypothetical protein
MRQVLIGFNAGFTAPFSWQGGLALLLIAFASAAATLAALSASR